MTHKPTIKTVYFAGKVQRDGYRQKLLGPKVMSLGLSIHDFKDGSLIYGGPFALSCKHGCWHKLGKHGLYPNQSGDENNCGNLSWMIDDNEKIYKSSLDHCGMMPQEAVERCINQITKCDAVHAFLESHDCYGTLVELGYASALKKPIYIYYKECIQNWDDQFWFVFNMPTVMHCGPGIETSIHKDLLVKLKDPMEQYREYLRSEPWDNLRKAKLKEAGYRCQLCNKADKLSVHHRTYERIFHEELSDLIALCSKCHEDFHESKRSSRKKLGWG